MYRLKLRLLLAVIGLLAWSAWTVVPQGGDAARLLAAADDPVRLADIALDRQFDAQTAAREIAAALAGDDADLAQSFLELADSRGVPVPSDLRRRVESANAPTTTAVRAAGRFVDGFVVGAPDDLAGLVGTVAGDLLVYGDVRDIVREVASLARGEAADELILGLACVGLAITAGTYASLGAASPVRVGISVVKAAGKTGRVSAKLADTLVRPLRSAVDMAAVRTALGPGALLQPVAAVRGVRSAIKVEKTGGVARVLGDIGRINGKAGTRAALDGLKLADSPKDVAKLARLADAKGGKTRAILKVLGRGAIALSVGLFQLASWMFWALLNMILLVAALKRAAERATERTIHRTKLRRARRLASPALTG
jgi:hypothetical protein